MIIRSSNKKPKMSSSRQWLLARDDRYCLPRSIMKEESDDEKISYPRHDTIVVYLSSIIPNLTPYGNESSYLNFHFVSYFRCWLLIAGWEDGLSCQFDTNSRLTLFTSG